jgi:hypothetical protein
MLLRICPSLIYLLVVKYLGGLRGSLGLLRDHLCGISRSQEYNHRVCGMGKPNWLVGCVNCCWSSLAQPFQVPTPAEHTTVFYCLTTLEIVQLLLPNAY